MSWALPEVLAMALADTGPRLPEYDASRTEDVPVPQLIFTVRFAAPTGAANSMIATIDARAALTRFQMDMAGMDVPSLLCSYGHIHITNIRQACEVATMG